MAGEHECNGELTARVEVLDGFSLSEAARYFKNFFEYERDERKADVVVAELPSKLAERLKEVFVKKTGPLHFSYVGHMAMLFDYAQNKRGVETHYTDMQGLPDVISKIRQAGDKTSLYQVCTSVNQEAVREVLTDAGFKLV